MTKQEIEQNIQKIADYYGLDNQLNKTIEECAELIQALVKLESRENKRKVAMLSEQIRPTKKPDGDNILKAVADALNGVCYKDDKCLIKMSIEKFYSDVPRIEVVVQEAVIIDENDDSEMMRK